MFLEYGGLLLLLVCDPDSRHIPASVSSILVALLQNICPMRAMEADTSLRLRGFIVGGVSGFGFPGRDGGHPM